MKDSARNKGAKPKISLEEKKNIAMSYYLVNARDQDLLKMHGIFTRLMQYANSKGYSINSINTFSEDKEFVKYLQELIGRDKHDVSPGDVVTGYEDIDVDHFLGLKKSELRSSLCQLRDKIRNIVKASTVAINSYKTIDEQRRGFEKEVVRLQEELASTKNELKRERAECRKAKADCQEYRAYIESNIVPDMVDEHIKNMASFDNRNAGEISAATIILNSLAEKEPKREIIDDLFE